MLEKKFLNTFKIFCFLCYYITLSHYKLTKQGGKVIFFVKKTKNYYFYKFDRVWIRDPD
jgi:hypothetical protein